MIQEKQHGNRDRKQTTWHIANIGIGLAVVLTLGLPLPALAAFGQYRSVTIDHTKVPSTQTNFPVLVNGVYSYLAVVASGGKVTDAQGDDIGFYSNANCSTGKLDWETVIWTSTTGTVEYWVEVPSLSSAVDTVIYLCYGNSSVTTDQSNKTGVWDTNYKGVWHMGDGVTIGLTDSTSNGLTLTNSGGVTAVVSPFGGAGSFNGSSQSLERASYTSGIGTGDFTMEVLSRSTGFVGYGGMFASGTYNPNFGFPNGASDGYFGFYFGGFNTAQATQLSTNTWYSLAGRRTGSTVSFYRDGAQTANTYTNTTAWDTTADLHIGTNGGNTGWQQGQLDEVRLSNIARSDNWLTTGYNTIATTTFYTVGNETPIGGNTLPRYIFGGSGMGRFTFNGGLFIFQ